MSDVEAKNAVKRRVDRLLSIMPPPRSWSGMRLAPEGMGERLGRIVLLRDALRNLTGTETPSLVERWESDLAGLISTVADDIKSAPYFDCDSWRTV